MKKTKIDSGDWVVVCDGAKALILENAGDSKFPNLKTIGDYLSPAPSTRELGSDAPGRAFASVGSVRSAVEQTDWHDQAERGFLKELAQRLDDAVGNGTAKRLVLVAAPRALGMLREVLSPAVRQAVRAEIGKDYVNVPVHEIEKRVIEPTAS